MDRIIRFQDMGQDFLTWTIDENGLVIDCQPFQGSVWCGATVTNHKELRAGSKVMVVTRFGQFREMNYKAISVKNAKP